MPVGLIGLEPQHGMERLVDHFLIFRQSFPRAAEQHVAPAVEELAIVVGKVEGRALHVQGALRERLRPGALPPMRVDDQVKEYLLDIVAEPASPGVGPPEPALEKTDGKLLRQVRGEVRVARETQQVVLDSPDITLHQLLSRVGRGIADIVLCAAVATTAFQLNLNKFHYQYHPSDSLPMPDRDPFAAPRPIVNDRV